MCIITSNIGICCVPHYKQTLQLLLVWNFTGKAADFESELTNGTNSEPNFLLTKMSTILRLRRSYP